MTHSDGTADAFALVTIALASAREGTDEGHAQTLGQIVKDYNDAGEFCLLVGALAGVAGGAVLHLADKTGESPDDVLARLALPS